MFCEETTSALVSFNINKLLTTTTRAREKYGAEREQSASEEEREGFDEDVVSRDDDGEER